MLKINDGIVRKKIVGNCLWLLRFLKIVVIEEG